MEARRLFVERDGKAKAITAAVCGKCGRVWESADSAERCCKCSYCGEYCDWHKSTSHDACQGEAWRKSEADQLEKAVLVPDYDGPFLFGETVYMDADDLLGSIEPDDLPEFGFCTTYQAPSLSIDILMENVGEMHNDWEPNDVSELAPAIEAWNKANENNGTYYEDRTRKWSKADILKAAQPASESSGEQGGKG